MKENKEKPKATVAFKLMENGVLLEMDGKGDDIVTAMCYGVLYALKEIAKESETLQEVICKFGLTLIEMAGVKDVKKTGEATVRIDPREVQAMKDFGAQKDGKA